MSSHRLVSGTRRVRVSGVLVRNSQPRRSRAHEAALQRRVVSDSLGSSFNVSASRSGEQIDIWSAVFGPIGRDGYFEPLFDKRTGVVNKQVARYWKENYDLLYYLQKNWPVVGPKLVDKFFFYTGDGTLTT
jgi:hypothetical protein